MFISVIEKNILLDFCDLNVNNNLHKKITKTIDKLRIIFYITTYKQINNQPMR